MKETQYSQGQKEVDSLVLPGEEASPAKISYDHRQEVLMEREEKHRERSHPGRGGKRGQEWESGVKSAPERSSPRKETCWFGEGPETVRAVGGRRDLVCSVGSALRGPFEERHVGQLGEEGLG